MPKIFQSVTENTKSATLKPVCHPRDHLFYRIGRVIIGFDHTICLSEERSERMLGGATPF